MKEIIKLTPSTKDYLWGGSRLFDIFGKGNKDGITAETWELSSRTDGPSYITGGSFDGKTFKEYLDENGMECIGEKGKGYSDFPLLVKFIDAQKPLSIQVHPGDEYARKYENEFGKNEFWYIVDCEENAFLYCGLKCDITKDELKKRIENNTITDVLNKVYVKKGDCIFIKAGTLHAIGEGIVVCEIQQNSNVTYRVYDYDRTDKDGNKRPLHIEKALEVADTKALFVNTEFEDSNVRELASCEYFNSTKLKFKGAYSTLVFGESFVSIVVLSGNGTIKGPDNEVEFKSGDSIFVPAWCGKIIIKSALESELIITRL